jgi:CRISPR/Cas system endoribonuclease Cas6 (RAMP superfamily)
MMKPRNMYLRAALTLPLAALALTACSQVAELQPVAGDAIISVQIATSDIVQSTVGTAVTTWPTCEFDGTTYTCTGRMIDGRPIVGTGTGTPIKLTVTVGDQQVYEGLVTDVIEKAGRSR